MKQDHKLPWYVWLPFIGAVLYLQVQTKFEKEDAEIDEQAVDFFYEYHFWFMLAAVIGSLLFEIFCINYKYHFL